MVNGRRNSLEILPGITQRGNIPGNLPFSREGGPLLLWESHYEGRQGGLTSWGKRENLGLTVWAKGESFGFNTGVKNFHGEKKRGIFAEKKGKIGTNLRPVYSLMAHNRGKGY